MMTVPDLLGVVLKAASPGMDFRFFHQRGRRKALLSAVCVIAMGCALMPAHARQSASSKGSAKKSTTSKSTKSKATTAKATTSRLTHRRHKVTTASSRSSGTMYNASSKKSLRRKKSSRVRGQQKIDPERAQAIQEALIRERYLTGEASGTWNPASEEAMRRYQADNGWQSKTVPDSRALIKLGLGPSKDHLLNPESAMTTVPDPPRATSIPPTSSTTAPLANTTAPTQATTPAAAGSEDPQ